MIVLLNIHLRENGGIPVLQVLCIYLSYYMTSQTNIITKCDDQKPLYDFSHVKKCLLLLFTNATLSASYSRDDGLCSGLLALLSNFKRTRVKDGSIPSILLALLLKQNEMTP